MKHGDPERTWVPLAHQHIGSAKGQLRAGRLIPEALEAMARDLIAAVEAMADAVDETLDRLDTQG